MIDANVSTCSTHQSSSVSFCRPLWVTPSRSSSSWRTRSVASVSLLLTSSLSSDRPCDERSSSCGTEKQLWIAVTGATANHSRRISGLSSENKRERVLDRVRSLCNTHDLSQMGRFNGKCHVHICICISCFTHTVFITYVHHY